MNLEEKGVKMNKQLLNKQRLCFCHSPSLYYRLLASGSLFLLMLLVLLIFSFVQTWGSSLRKHELTP